MTVNVDGTHEIEPTMPLQITGAQIEPWTSKMIDREQPAYLFTLQPSRPATPAEKIVGLRSRGHQIPVLVGGLGSAYARGLER